MRGLWLLLIVCCLVQCGRDEPDRVYRVARDPRWLPLRLMGKEKSFHGFHDELLSEIASNEGFRVEFFGVATNNLFSRLRRKSFDAILTSQVPRRWRNDVFVLSMPMYRTGPVLIVSAGSDVSTIEEMEGKSIGIEIGSRVAFNIQENPTLIITPFKNILLALESLTNGQIDGVVMEAIPAYIYVNSFYRGKIKITTSPLNRDAVHLVALDIPEGVRLIERMDQGLEALKESGVYDSLLIKWGLINPEL